MPHHGLGDQVTPPAHAPARPHLSRLGTVRRELRAGSVRSPGRPCALIRPGRFRAHAATATDAPAVPESLGEHPCTNAGRNHRDPQHNPLMQPQKHRKNMVRITRDEGAAVGPSKARRHHLKAVLIASLIAAGSSVRTTRSTARLPTPTKSRRGRYEGARTKIITGLTVEPKPSSKRL